MPESQKLTRSVDLEPRRGSRGASWAGLKSIRVCKRIVKTGVSRPNPALRREPVSGAPAPHRRTRRLALDGGFVPQHNLDFVLYRVHPLALASLQPPKVFPRPTGRNIHTRNPRSPP